MNCSVGPEEIAVISSIFQHTGEELLFCHSLHLRKNVLLQNQHYILPYGLKMFWLIVIRAAAGRNLTTPEEMGPDVILSRPPEPSCVTFKFSEGCIAVVDIVVNI